MRDKWAEETSQKLCAFDLDGVLNYYPATWVSWLNSQLGTNYNNLNEAKHNISYSLYKSLKWRYRESGEKAHLEVRAGAKDVMVELYNRGYKILILTSRPFRDHPTLFRQTIDWLIGNGIPFEDLHSSSEKYAEVLMKSPGIRFLVDDHRYYANSVARWGYDTFLVDNPYNQGSLEERVHRISELKEILEYERLFYSYD